MKTNVIVNDNNVGDTTALEVGQYYQDMSNNSEHELYLIMQIDGTEFGLVQLSGNHTGTNYSGMSTDIDKIFGGDRNDFRVVSKIQLVVMT